jgi:hypothetical protein
MEKRKVTEIFEDKLVAEVYEKVRDSDGKRFYDTIIQRRYFDSKRVEHRTPSYTKRDLLSMHILLVLVDRYIATQLWQNRSAPGGTRDVESGDEADKGADDGNYLEG